MNEIKCIENLIRLHEMLLKGEKGDAAYFSRKLGISKSTFFRLIKYLEFIYGYKINYSKIGKTFYLESL